jgi:hypothetical protein
MEARMEGNIPIISLALSAGTVAVAGIVAIITYQQYRTNRLRLRHELFERRFAIFKETQRYLTKIMEEGRLTDEMFQTHYPDFMDAWQRSRFLFGPDIANHLDEIRHRSIEMRARASQGNHDAVYRHLNWLVDQTPRLFERFGPYLSFPVK